MICIALLMSVGRSYATSSPIKDGIITNKELISDIERGKSIEFIKNADGDVVVADNKAIIDAISSLDLSYVQLDSLVGIEYFTNLEELNCAHNYLTSLDVSMLTKLNRLDCSVNKLTTLDVSNLTQLKYLDCTDNTLDVSNITRLERLYCSNNQLTMLNVSSLTVLKTLNCRGNKLKRLDVSNLRYLRLLNYEGNRRIKIINLNIL